MMATTTKTAIRMVPLADMVLDYDLYPRALVDSVHVSHMVEALQAGEELPPILLDFKSKRIVDGFHRYKAYGRYHKKDAEVPAVLQRFPSEKDIYLEAMRCNSSHGRRLSSYDRIRCIARAADLKIPQAAAAAALNITVAKLADIRRERTATRADLVTQKAGAPTQWHRTIALKYGNRHLAGESLSVEQIAANERGSGMTTIYHVNELIRRIDGNLVDKTDEPLMGRFRELKRAIGRIR